MPNSLSGIFDFRIHRPSYVISKATEKWKRTQKAFEDFAKDTAKRDNLQQYLDEIDSVKEIYENEFNITGNVLDVGGNLGTLRHYLSEEPDRIYVCVDPFLNTFQDVPAQPNLLRAYPCLSLPCNFLGCYAEHLPFVVSCFDWVHMRSVVDHFEDPYLAFKEAYRVLRPNGRVLVGLSILERKPYTHQSAVKLILQKTRKDGVLPALRAIARKFRVVIQPEHDDHVFRLKYKELLDLFSVTGFDVEKEHWQKAPFTHVIYVSARKTPLE
jgi:SAM-dependent methyltransferase